VFRVSYLLYRKSALIGPVLVNAVSFGL
jgi:hypothetical protein